MQSKEGTNISSIVSPHREPVAHCILLRPTLCLLIDMEGQVSLHSRPSQQKWHHVTTEKLFECPVVAIDHRETPRGVTIALVGFDKSLKILRSNGEELLPDGQFFLPFLNSVVTSCVWDQTGKDLILGCERGAIFQYDLASRQLRLALQMYREQPVKLQKTYENKVLAGCGSKIYEISYDRDEMITDCLLELGQGHFVDDFIISRDKFYNTLVILARSQLLFYEMEELTEQPQSFRVDQNALSHSLSWGSSFEEMCVYSQSSARNVSTYRCDWNGKWYLQNP